MTDTTTRAERYYGADCPQGMVQIEFVGVDPSLRYGEYGYKPSAGAFLEVYVDGRRFHIAVGNVTTQTGEVRRGLHIIGDWGIEVDKHSVNALDVLLPKPAEVAA